MSRHSLIARLAGTVPRAEELVLNPTDAFLILAPHADDETLGAGGLMAMAGRAGSRLSVMVLTNGASLKPRAGEEREAAPQLTEARRHQCLASLAVLGVERVKFLNAVDGRLRSHVGEVAEAVAHEIEKFRPTHILLPHSLDRHPDHRACRSIVRRSLAFKFREGLEKPVLLGYEIWLPCHATHCLDISDVIDRKRSAIEQYRASFRKVDLKDMILGLNRYRAATELTRSGWCEAFEQMN